MPTKKPSQNFSNVTYSFSAIGVVHSCFKEKFATPRQSGLVAEATGVIELFEPFNDPNAVLGLEQFSHLWVQFVFDQSMKTPWRAKVRPPRLGGNATLGVFATRAPVRPNPIGLSVVKLDSVEVKPNQVLLHVSGLDMVEGTPVLDIKPYIHYADSILNARSGFADTTPTKLPVVFSSELKELITDSCEYNQSLIASILGLDPRPQYQQFDESRIYTANIENVDVSWVYRPTEGDQWQIEVIALKKLKT
ncbi:tRNA (N6-threonylcarbamoyladenosine(37)-N6)-methyltransferase TrmO [Sessilibacter sp. MAH4]